MFNKKVGHVSLVPILVLGLVFSLFPYRPAEALTYLNRDPIGYLDYANCDIIAGWAVDLDAPGDSATITIYVDGVVSGLGTYTTPYERPDVNAAYGITGNHGFHISTPESLKDGTSHSIYVYVRDTGSNSGFNITNSPLYLQCAPTTPPPPPPAAAPTISVLTPNGGESLLVNQSSSISWSTQNAPTGAKVDLAIYRNEALAAEISYSQNPSGTYSWFVGPSNSTFSVGSGYKVKVTLYVPGGPNLATDFSDSSFSIVGSSVPGPAITFTTTSLPSATVGSIYVADIYFTKTTNFALNATISGQPAEIGFWGVSGRDATMGILFDSIRISGAPTQPGTYTVKITLTDQNNPPVSKDYQLVVNPGTSNIALTLDGATPLSKNVAQGTSNVPVLKYKITNSSVTPVTISTMDIGLTGSARTTDIKKVYWYDNDSNTLLGQNTIAATTVGAATAGHSYITLDTPYVIPAFSSKVVFVLADISESAINGTTFAFTASIWSKDSAVVGSAIGKLMTITNSTDVALTLQVSYPVNGTYEVTPTAKNEGALWFQAFASGADITIGQLNFGAVTTNLPNCSLDNIRLFDSLTGVQLGAATTDSNCLVQFKNLSLTVAKGSSKHFVLIVAVPDNAPSGSKFYYNLSQVSIASPAAVAVYGMSNIVGKQFTIQSSTPTPTPLPPPPPPIYPVSNIKPLGWIDSVSNGMIKGWALDKNHLSEMIQVHVYFDLPAGQGFQSYAFLTEVFREDVNNVFGATGYHGFELPIPDLYRNGTHKVYAYAIDPDDSTGRSNVQLFGSGKTFTYSAAPAERHARGTVVIAPDGTVYFLGSEMRYAFPSPEVFFSWGHKFTDLVQANEADLAMPIGPIATAKQ